jgi:hypothetical protein
MGDLNCLGQCGQGWGRRRADVAEAIGTAGAMGWGCVVELRLLMWI